MKYRTYTTKNGLTVRSKLEIEVIEQLEEEGIEYEYEPCQLTWRERDPRARCGNCGTKGKVYTDRSYTPDIRLKNGTFLEIKGRLTSRDRKLLTSVRECNPTVDLRLLFSRDNLLSRKSKTRYSEWAHKRGFKYCIGRIPASWLK